MSILPAFLRERRDNKNFRNHVNLKPRRPENFSPKSLPNYQAVKNLSSEILKEDVLCILLWGSLIRKEKDKRSDIDILVITDSRRERTCISREDLVFEISYYPLNFVKEGIMRGDWWFVEALKYGFVLFDKNQTVNSLLAHFDTHYYLDNLPDSWLKIANSFYLDALDLMDEGDPKGAVLNARYSAESAITALLLSKGTIYPTPKRILGLLHKNGSKKLVELFDNVAGLQAIDTETANAKIDNVQDLIDLCAKSIKELTK